MKYLEEEKDFNELIKEGRVLVDFYADWCGPCKMLSPVIDSIAEENKDIKIIKVNIDNFENIAREYKVMSIPTLIVFEDGKERNKQIGLVSKAEILQMLD